MPNSKNGPPEPLDLQRIQAAVAKTGFNLEFSVSEQFRTRGWSVINNKYYVDDIAHSVREIDIVAYKTEQVGKIQVYTTLIVSCKKSDTNIWALLSKPLRVNDPNIDWHPQHAWSSDSRLDHMLTKTDWVPQYLDTCKQHDVYRSLISPERHVFAFQEIDKTKYTCQNDTAIFNSVSSLMKAQGYEIGALKLRKRSPAVYLFNLLTVVDAPLVRIDYQAADAQACQLIDDDRYIGSYIINQKEITARIHIVTASAFPRLLDEYANLHICNGSVVADLVERFYDDCIDDDERSAIIDPEFNSIVRSKLNSIIHYEHETPWKNRTYKARKVGIGNSVAVNSPDLTADEMELLNRSFDAKRVVSRALETCYHYQGPWSFDHDLPF